MKTIKNTTTKSTFWAIILFYGLIAFEFFYMASPFAAYFYGVYKPCLTLLDKFPAISWITGFFLPHLVEDTKSGLINSLRTIGAITAGIGFITFLVCAFQVYYAKLFKKGMVKGGLYTIIRHPQYTAFSVCSFGLLLLWPRYLVLIMFITLLFAYYLLAKAEERECENKFGDDYIRYKNRTFMFLPFFNIPYPKKQKALFLIVLYILVLFVALQTGRYIKHSSIASLYSECEGKATYVSIFKMPANQMNTIVATLNKNEKIRNLLKEQENELLISYILPTDMYISEIPMVKPQNENCHVYNSRYSINCKIVYTQAKLPNGKVKDENDALFNAIQLYPLIEAWYDIRTKTITKIIELPASSIQYKNTPEPIF